MTLKPGERVSEQDIAKTFGVSRTSVREAVFRLTNMGLVKVLPQRGTFIAKFQRDFLLEAVFVRRALEEAVIFAVAGNLDGKVIDAAQKS
jgi:DNA-binding GntR family transcriptional regulator